jgi:hypothetical protein
MLWHVIRHIYSLEVAVKDHHLNTLHLSHHNIDINPRIKNLPGSQWGNFREGVPCFEVPGPSGCPG